MDGGVRRGSDIAKAICLGARAVLIGRAYAYGLGAAGEAGVARAIAILRADLERTLALLGCESIGELIGPTWMFPQAGRDKFLRLRPAVERPRFDHFARIHPIIRVQGLFNGAHDVECRSMFR